MCVFALAPEALDATLKNHHKTCVNEKHVCPQKWTVKVMGTYLTYTITLDWGKKSTQSALTANIKKNKT